MDPDVLERLAADRALGMLTPDVEQLLDAYLRLDPQAQATAGEIDRTVRLARETLAEKQPSSMPAFPVAGFLQIERWHKRVQRFTVAAGLAACLSIGLGLGRLTAPQADADSPASPAEIVASESGEDGGPSQAGQNSTFLVQSIRPVDQGGFWSVERLREMREQERLQPASSSDRPVRVSWPDWHRPT